MITGSQITGNTCSYVLKVAFSKFYEVCRFRHYDFHSDARKTKTGLTQSDVKLIQYT